MIPRRLVQELGPAVPKMGQISESGTFPECKIMLITRFLPSLCR